MRRIVYPVLLMAALVLGLDHLLLGTGASPSQKPKLRTLEVYYSRRAYPGAPPIIPHPLFEDRSSGGTSCLACHKGGAFVAPFNAYAPVTPHPDWTNCRQCHVPQKEQTPSFSGSNWHKLEGPSINREAIPGGPPPIPHSLQNRLNCNACHAGPSAVAEIRTPHPERPNCQQCHVSAGEGTWRR